MEVAGGAIAVVSLGLQLVDTIKKASRFIRGIRDAPAEISTFASNLQHLHLTLDKVTGLITRQREGENLSASTDLLESAVRNCEPNITNLSKLIHRLQKRFERNGRHRATWASVSSVIKKDDLERYRGRIQEDLIVLNTAISLSTYELNLTQMTVFNATKSTSSMTTSTQTLQGTVSTQTGTLIQDQQTQNDGHHGRPMWKRRDHKIACTESFVRMYWGLLGYATVRTKIRRLLGPHGEDLSVNEEKMTLFHPSFIRTAIGFCQLTSGGRVSRSLRYFPILPKSSALFDLCYIGDLEGFRLALTRNEVPISAQDEYGWTLLHYACCGGGTNVELCSLLVHLGVDSNHVDIHGRKALEMVAGGGWWSSSACVESMIFVLTRNDKDLTELDVDRCAKCYTGPPEGLELLLSPDVYPVELDWRQLPLTFIVTALKNFAANVPTWTKFIQRVVRLSADLHRVHWDHRQSNRDTETLSTMQDRRLTLLDELLYLVISPEHGEFVVQAWLDILSTEGHDVRSYLETEMTLHADQDLTFRCPWRRSSLLMSLDLSDEPRVSVDWWIDPATPGNLVCEEFKCMNYMLRGYRGTSCDGWPFIDFTWSILTNWAFSIPEGQHILDMTKSRAARRAEKRRTKAARAAGTYRCTRMPGAWIN